MECHSFGTAPVQVVNAPLVGLFTDFGLYFRTSATFALVGSLLLLSGTFVQLN